MTQQEIISTVRAEWGKMFPGEKAYFAFAPADNKTRIHIKYFRPEMKTYRIADFCKKLNCSEYSLKFRR